ncbi:alpha/beta hydrolase [Pigmentiphaga sp. YJ18]|uniref:alpha/beta fold hydrolase n=1 Tax=Pigmentiphaga sp. YJ18 TaxID=3134907 RepID=UPI0031181668
MTDGARLPLVCLHGWGFDASTWAPMRAHLDGWDIHADDAGYFGRTVAAERPAAYVAVGHSLGAMRSLEDAGAGCRGLVLINGFARFSAAGDFPTGVAARVLDRMLTRLAADPAAVVSEFRRRCGAADPIDAGTLDEAVLAAGLRQLRAGDARAAWAARRVPVRILAGDADPVVTPALTAASFGGEAVWCAGGGHLLPLTHPAWCASQIRAFVRELAGAPDPA